MNKLYHKIAVASVCTALGFALGINKEAKAGTFTFDYFFTYHTFQAIDGGSYGSFDGRGDTVTNVGYGDLEMQPHTWHDAVERTDAKEVAALIEFPFSYLTRSITPYGENAKITSITNAVLQVYVWYWESSNDSDVNVMGAFGYEGNGIAEASDFEAGVFLNSRELREYGTWYDFNVTPFVKQVFSNNNEFAGFALRSLNQNRIVLPISQGIHPYPPKLIVSGEFEGGVEPEPVPEPTTIFGSVIGLCLGGWLKRRKSSSQHKTTPQD